MGAIWQHLLYNPLIILGILMTFLQIRRGREMAKMEYPLGAMMIYIVFFYLSNPWFHPGSIGGYLYIFWFFAIMELLNVFSLVHQQKKLIILCAFFVLFSLG
jgi:hypothetical protein